ncbi:DUF4394 domain-containing protein [Halococcus hamelinensis]|uniref:DUF4394 domain-containing protein n=1 Tax=Halococcus hamelinensis 100A6 TaxID=1132509 RepID=M0LZJ9_9EURY|nr:DUF4394 domain-containing protein [Halococcus hamelinensis]EMA37804.1 hypothetical protein C447_12565 [Halococcus hamelinensis 100A6]
MDSEDNIPERIEAGESFADLGEFRFDDTAHEQDDVDRENETTTDLLTRVGSALDRRSFMSNTAKVGVGAVALGTLGAGTAAADHQPPVYGFTLVPAEGDGNGDANMEHAVALVAQDDGTANALVPVDLESGEIWTDKASRINGVSGDDLLVGIDYRPSDEMLYALDENGTLYTVEMPSKAGKSVSASSVGSADYPDTDLIDGIGFDFNPVADAIRIVTTDGDSFVTSADDGSIVRQDPDAFYMDGDDNEGTTPQLSAAGYTNSVPSPSATMLYDIDSNLDVLVQQDADPDSDTTSGLTTIGGLGIDANAVNGFDISGTDGAAYALVAVDGETKLYRIDLEVGSAMPVAEDDMGNGGMGGMGGGNVTDVDILNFALALEHLEAAYYNEFLEEYSETDVERADAIGKQFADPQLRFATYQEISSIRDHEEAHVEALTQTIQDLGGTPVEAAEYAFPYDSLEEFVKFSARVEAVGTSAYAGAGPLIENDEVVAAALSIHSVEARHTSWFRALIPGSSMPNAFDMARNMDQVLGIVNPLIVSE